MTLQPKALDLLVALVESGGNVLTKDELLNLVWPGQVVEESNLTVHMSALRKALGERKGEHRFVVTQPGRGYRFVAGVDEVQARTDAGALLPTPGELPMERPRARVAMWLGSGSMLCAVLIAGAVAYWRGDAQPKPAMSASGAAAPEMTIKRLTTSGRVSTATLSPDGKFFAYVHRETDGQYSLWLNPVEGSGTVRLLAPTAVTGFSVTFAPDGTSLFYCLVDPAHPQGQLFRSPLLGGTPENLGEKRCGAMAFSPDGKKVAFVQPDSARAATLLLVANLNGSDQREIAARPFAQTFIERTLAWSPDGSTIVVGAVTNENVQSQEIFSVDVSEGTVTPITTLSWRSIQRIGWFGDGTGMVVVAVEKNSPQQFSQLWSVAYPTGQARRITSDLSDYASVASIGAGDEALLAVEAHSALTNIWVAPAANVQQATRISAGSRARYDGLHGLDWTPDGRIVYVAVVGESRTIWMMDANGDNARQLTAAGYADSNPSVTADGRYLVFQSNRSGRDEIWRADIDGGNARQLTQGGGNTQPHVSPDGRWVLYISSRDGLNGLWRISIGGGDPVRLTDKPTSWPRISPDGTQVACGYVAERESGQQRLAVMAIDGTGPVKLFDVTRLANFRNGIRWTPDGVAVTYRDWADGIWRQPLSGGEPQRVPGLPQEKLFTYGWSPDGQRFAFTRGTERRNAVLLTNFR